MRILVVDDNAQNVLNLSMALRREGYEVVSTTDGLEALQMVKRLKPALVLLDILMPVHDGIEIGMRLKEDPLTREVPVIFLTALTGAREVETMSFDSDKLVGAIRQVVQRAA